MFTPDQGDSFQQQGLQSTDAGYISGIQLRQGKETKMLDCLLNLEHRPETESSLQGCLTGCE